MIKKQLKKIAAVVMVAAFALSLSVASADTVINNYTAPSTVMVSFTRDLTIGSTGADVSALQGFLVEKGFLVMPAGVAMGYFGNLTQAALGAYQASVGISPSAGYFGPITRAYVSSHWTMTSNLPAGCTSTAGFSSTTGMRCDSGSTSTLPAGCTSTAGYSPITGIKCDGTTSNNNNGSGNGGGNILHGGEASLSNFDAKSGTDSDVQEADQRDEVMDFSFDVDDADAEVNRVDVHFMADSGNKEDKPWKVFNKVYLLSDGQVISTISTNTQKKWSHETGDEYQLRFTGLNEIVRQGDAGHFTIAVDVANSVKGADTGNANWVVWIPDDGIRATDSAGVDNFIGDDADTISFDINQAGQDEELTIREASDNPHGPSMQVEDSRVSDWSTVLKFEASSKNNDIQINSIPFFVQFGSGLNHSNVINDARLLVDGRTYDNFSWSSSTSTGTITFDTEDDDLTVNEGETMDMELQFRFNAANGGSNYTNGQTIEADLRSGDVDNIDAEGEDNLDASQLKGSANGDQFALTSSGITVSNVSSTQSLNNNGTTDVSSDDYGIYTLTFDVSAFDEDQWIELTAASSAVATANGVDFTVENSSNVTVGTGSINDATLERVSGGTTDGNFVRVGDGQTVRLRLTVYYDPAASASYRVQMNYVGFNDTEASADMNQALTPGEDYDSGLLFINN